MRLLAGVARRPWLSCAVVLAVLVAWLFSAALFSSKVLGAQDILLFQTPFAEAGIATNLGEPSNEDLFDTFYQMQPDMLFAGKAIRNLDLPVWSPWIGTGEPLLATQQHAIFYPINTLSAFLPFFHSLEWLAALKLLVAGLGMLFFLRRLGVHPLGALLGAISFAFCSYLVDWIEHPLPNAWVLSGWLLWATDRIAERARWRDAALLAMFAGFALLGGNPQSAFQAALPTAPWLLMRLVQRRRAEGAGGRELARAAGVFAGGGALGIALAGVVVLPFLEIAGQAAGLTRGGGGQPANFLFGFFAPELWGRPDKSSIPGGPINYFERTTYIGAAAAALAAGGLAARRTAPQLFFTGLAALALGVVVKVPVYTELAFKVPGIAQINRNRLLMLVCLAGSVLAAYGLHHLLTLESRRRRALLVGVAALAAIAPLTWLVAHDDVLAAWRDGLAQLPNIQPEPLLRPVVQAATFLRWGLFAGLAVLLALVAVWRPRWRVGAAVVIVALAAFDIVSFQRGMHPATPIAWADPPEPPMVTELRGLMGHDRIGGLVEMPPNLGNRFELRDVRKYESPPLERRYRLWAALGGGGSDHMTLPPESTRAYDIFSVRWAVSYSLAEKETERWRVVRPPIVENRFALPRAWVAYDWRDARGEDDAFAKVTGGSASQAYRTPVIEGAGAPPRGRVPGPAPAKFLTDGERGLRLAVSAARPGWLMLHDTWYPGWKADVDGREVPIEHGNLAFRAVRVPAGDHEVTFSYSPVSARAGALVSIGAGLTIAVLLLGPWLRRRLRPGASRPAAGSGRAG